MVQNKLHYAAHGHTAAEVIYERADAEIQAMRHNPMYMSDYVEHLDNVLKATGEKILEGSGQISHAQAIEKAKSEYQKYRIQNLSPVEQEYLTTIKNIEKKAKKNK